MRPATEAALERTIVELYNLQGHVVHRAQVLAGDVLPEALIWRDRVFRRATIGADAYRYRELEAALVSVREAEAARAG